MCGYIFCRSNRSSRVNNWHRVLALRGIREIWWTVIVQGGGGVSLLCTGGYPLIRWFDQRARISRAFQGPLPRDPSVASRRRGNMTEGHEFSFSPNYSVHHAAGRPAGGVERGTGSQFSTRDLRPPRSFCADELAFSFLANKDPLPRIGKSIGKKRTARAAVYCDGKILRRIVSRSWGKNIRLNKIAAMRCFMVARTRVLGAFENLCPTFGPTWE